MIDAPASKSFTRAESLVASADAGGGRAQRTTSASLFTWLNLACLDAPLVAVSWQWLFARSLNLPIARGATAALFLTAWLIYLADRFGDSLSVARTGPTSSRQRFCLRHRAAWLMAMFVVALANVGLMLTRLETATLRFGAAVGTCALVYLVVNQRAQFVWRVLPLKEIAIGVLFAAGVMVGLAAALPSALLLPWTMFAALCSLNCISIAVWERALDAAQSRVSIATAFPRSATLLPIWLGALIVASIALATRSMSMLYLCIASSAMLLAILQCMRARLAPDTRTAMADLVLLTPLFLLVLC